MRCEKGVRSSPRINGPFRPRDVWRPPSEGPSSVAKLPKRLVDPFHHRQQMASLSTGGRGSPTSCWALPLMTSALGRRPCPTSAGIRGPKESPGC